MLEKRVVFSQIEITANGALQVRLDKQVVEGADVVAHDYHRFLVEPDGNVEDMISAVTKHLAQMGYPAPAADQLDRVRRVAAMEHTPDVVKRYGREKLDRQIAEADESIAALEGPAGQNADAAKALAGYRALRKDLAARRSALG